MTVTTSEDRRYSTRYSPVEQMYIAPLLLRGSFLTRGDP